MSFKESETIEFKESTGKLKEGLISISAILNKHKKGQLYFGICDSGKIIGLTISNKTLRDISSEISQHIEPKIYPVVEGVNIQGKECVKIEFQGANMPYSAYNRYYLRVADEDRPISHKELEKLFLANQSPKHWDREVCADAKIKDISESKLKEFCKSSGLIYDSKINVLNKLNLVKNEKPLNTAILFFAETPEKYIHNARLRCATFATTDTANPIDMQEFSGDLFELIKKAEVYILTHINVGMRLEGMRRIDVPEINEDAFREAIINAFCHRDYLLYDSVNIAVFKDKVEIRSPGDLFGGLTINDIITKPVSKRRNELIADIFHKVHFVERWGTGIKKILAKEPKAKFELVAGNEFRSVFLRDSQMAIKSLEKTVEISTQKTTQKTTQKILNLISESSQITRKELSEKLNISENGVKFHLNRLKQKGFLERIGPDKGGHWVVKKSKV